MGEVKEKQPQFDVSICILEQLVHYLEHLNLDINQLFRSLSIDPAILSNPEARLPFKAYVDIEDEAVRMSGDLCFGLHMGEFFDVGNWSILGYIMMNCRNLGEAFEKYGRYSRIVGNLINWSVQFVNWNTIRHTLTTPKNAPELSRHCFETAMASIVKMARILSGTGVNAREVGFAFPSPEFIAEYERFFCCPVKFGQKNYYIIVDLRIGKIPVKQPNAALLEHFENYAREYLLSIENTGAITAEVLRLILLHLDSGVLNIGKIAKLMAVSKRTLQNQLKQEGTEFSKLLEQTRISLSTKYLKENRTAEEITFRLGFSDPSVFRKSFRKWTGSTPKEFRSSISQQASS